MPRSYGIVLASSTGSYCILTVCTIGTDCAVPEAGDSPPPDYIYDTVLFHTGTKVLSPVLEID